MGDFSHGEIWGWVGSVEVEDGWGGRGGLHLRRRWKEKLLRGETKGEEYSKAEGGSKVK